MQSNKKLEKYVNKRGITGAVFDIDNTLLATTQYYKKKIRQLTKNIAPKISKDPQDDVVKGIENSIKTRFRKSNRKPVLIDSFYLWGLKNYLKKDVPKIIEKEVIKFFADFYTTVPTAYKSTGEILKRFLECNIEIVLYSHAQEDWTKLKTDYLSNLVNYNLRYFSTPIEENKDKNNWLKVFKLINSKPSNTFVVGDNLYADIFPSIEAGTKYLTWINRHKEELDSKKIDKDVELTIIKDISEILDSLE